MGAWEPCSIMAKDTGFGVRKPTSYQQCLEQAPYPVSAQFVQLGGGSSPGWPQDNA